MQKTYVEDKVYDKVDFATNPLPLAEYDHCAFTNCNFANANLLQIHFTNCKFTSCNLSGAKLDHTAFKDILFKDCKMFGLHFENCNPFLFAISPDNCTLNLSSFYRVRLKNTKFKNCGLQEVDFTEADVSNAIFENCDLAAAIFDNTNLEKADLRSAVNYSIDPQQNRIKKAKFSMNGISGLLYKHDIQIEQ